MISIEAQDAVSKMNRFVRIDADDLTITEAVENIVQEAIDAAVKPYRDVLQGIIDGCVHPETAYRRVMVDLKPIRKVLDLKQKT